nr:MAG TPA: Single stranded DNA binding protein [Caudoviricetes sp.]
MNNLTLVDELQESSKQMYCSLVIKTEEDKKMLYNLLGNCDFRVADKLDTEIALKDVLIQKFTNVDDETGAIEEKYRVILIDKDNKTYASGSKGLYRSLGQLLAIMGEPSTWSEPIKIKVVETNLRNNAGKTYVIKTI